MFASSVPGVIRLAFPEWISPWPVWPIESRCSIYEDLMLPEVSGVENSDEMRALTTRPGS